MCIDLIEMELIVRVVVMLALSYMVGPCNCTGLCSPATYEFRLSKDGAFHFPVFHRKHPCLDDPSPVHAASVSDAGTVVGNDEIHKGKYFMAISLGTPSVFNLVTIDTGSTLSWVNCERCEIRCHGKADEAGPRFDPHSSATYRQIGCSDEDCVDIHQDNGIPYGCIDETDTCLYSVRYGSQYSAGKLGRDRLALGDNLTVVDDFVFGCSEDDRFYGKEAGVIGFGNKSYSFFNQMARQTSYVAFAYCFPSDHQAEGFLIVGPYPQRLELVTPLIRGYGRRWYVYSLLLLDMKVDGKRLEVDPTVDTRQIMVVDSGTDDTFVSSVVFYALAEAVTSAMGDKGYYREYGSEKVCFKPAGGEPVNWRGLPAVEMQFLRAALKLPPENVFHQQSADRICLAFQPDTSGVRDVRILGNRALRSFRVVYDLQKMTFGFQARAC
ncbi:hypothetical protein SETIT_7G325800v2 [Setaria italica]|uniref:Peptidase A1 domain-containing protein n=3 Tax=Setaria italica TaxID=4555 RepID=A0A368S297_SETIT|nr:hypothetical protein SETIT_7G325800v2 [Setaria italica]